MTKNTYVAPQTVLSPKASVSELHVVYDGGVNEETSVWGGWSMATMLWDGYPTVGVRWNGNRDWIGTPQSRGLPTWFILPEPLAKLAQAEVEKHKNGDDGEESPRHRLLDLITYVRSASDEELNAMIGQMGLRPSNPAVPAA